jgi:hypothetical protein
MLKEENIYTLKASHTPSYRNRSSNQKDKPTQDFIGI